MAAAAEAAATPAAMTTLDLAAAPAMALRLGLASLAATRERLVGLSWSAPWHTW